MHVERQAVNYIIQGGEADIMKLGMIQVAKAGYTPILQVHDELHFEVLCKEGDVYDQFRLGHVMSEIKIILENVIKLDVPLIVSGGHGKSWFLAK